MFIQKDFFGNEHIIEPVELDDIIGHYRFIQPHVIKKSRFIKNMKACIEAGTAFKIGDDCFLYYLNYTPELADMVCIQGRANLIPLLIGIFTQIDRATFCMKVDPNVLLDPGWEKPYRSIMRKTSLEARGGTYPIVCRIDELLKHYKKLKRYPA